MSSAPDPDPTWIVAIGASGDEGLRNIKSVLQALGPGLAAVVMVVLHRGFDRPTRLREVLGAATPMPVFVADDQQELRPGCCYIGEPASHLTLLARGRGEMTDDPGRLPRGRTVDLLFRSVAKNAGRCGIGIVLSGALDDGSRGLEAIHHAGGKTMVILRSAWPRGMPENAIAYDGPVDCIGSPGEIAAALRDAVGRRAEATG